MTLPLARLAEEVQHRILCFLDAEDLLSTAGVCSFWRDLPEIHDCWSELCSRYFPEIAAAFASHIEWAPRNSAEWRGCYGRLRHAGLAHGIRCPCCSRDGIADYVALFGEHLHLVVGSSSKSTARCDKSAAVAGGSNPRMAIPLLQTAKSLVANYLEASAMPRDDFDDLATKTCLEYQRLRAGQLGTSLSCQDAMLPLEDFLDYWRELLLGDGLTGSEALRLRELVIALRHRNRRRGRGGARRPPADPRGGRGAGIITPARAA